MKKATATTLATFDAFAALSCEERSEIAKSMALQEFQSSQPLIVAADDKIDVYFIISGTARTYCISPTGKQVQYCEYSAGMICGHMSAIDGRPRQTDIVARTPVVAATVTAAVFRQILVLYPSVATAVMRQLTERLRMNMQRVYEFSTESVGGRVRLELLRMVEKATDKNQSNSIRFEKVPTHAEIASRISTHREAVTRELKNLEKQGIVDWRPGNYVVHDIHALEAITNAALEFRKTG